MVQVACPIGPVLIIISVYNLHCAFHSEIIIPNPFDDITIHCESFGLKRVVLRNDDFQVICIGNSV